MPPHLGAEELVQRRIHLLVYHTSSLAGLPHRDRMRETSLVDEPYWLVCRPGHPVFTQSISLEGLVHFDWALAGYDRQFESSLPDPYRHLFQEHGVPRYRLLNQFACVELVKRTDMLTAVPQSSAQAMAEKGEVAAMPIPGDLRFSIIAAVLCDAANEPAVEHFIKCL